MEVYEIVDIKRSGMMSKVNAELKATGNKLVSVYYDARNFYYVAVFMREVK